MLFTTPPPDLDDHAAIDGVHAMRRAMASDLRAPRRWTGGLRRTTQARAIQGSNSIEGYSVSEQDAVAAVEGEEPLTADERTWVEIVAYRRVLTFVLRMAPSPGFAIDPLLLRSMHFMLLEHELSKCPGHFRTGPVYVHDETAGRTVHEGPDSDLVPGLVEELTRSLVADRDLDPLVRGAMAHLNLVMVHPFRDGNGRMARALQTLVLAQDAVLEPTFSSIEEWLGSNTGDYYSVLAATGQGAWHPENDCHLWVKFNLRAHHMQAQTLQQRFQEADRLWRELDAIVREQRLPDRVLDVLFDAARGLRVQRPTYVRRMDLEDRTGTRDLARLVDTGLLRPVGQTRGRYYLAGDELRARYAEVRSARTPLDDPYPTLMDEVRRAAAPGTALLTGTSTLRT